MSRAELCGFCEGGTYRRLGWDGQPDGFTYTCPYCDGTGYVQEVER